MTAIGFVDDRVVLSVTGADARPLLQDLVTNDVAAAVGETLVYSALLTPQGKYLFDFFMAEGPAGDLLIDVAADRAAALAQRLSMYRLRRDMEIAATELTVACLWDDEDPDRAPDVGAGAFARRDPRDPALGWRAYGASIAASGASREDYDRRRVTLGVPATGVELTPDDTYILEAGFERLHGVDFRKGCYVGQEVTARMKHKTELKKGLARVAIIGDVPPGTPIEAGGKPAGTLFTVSGGEGLAHLRFDRAGGEMTAGGATLRRI